MRRRWPWVAALSALFFLIYWNLQHATETRKPLRATSSTKSHTQASRSRLIAHAPQETPAPTKQRATPKPKKDATFPPEVDSDGLVTLNFVISDYEGEPVKNAVLESKDCRIYRIAKGGHIAVKVLDETSCTFRGGRRDGMLLAWSESESIEAEPGLSAIYLDIPIEETAGMGISIAPHDDGVLVRWVVPGSPAETAGILRGDIVVELDGSPVSEMTVDEFIAQGTGPIGTSVTLVVARFGPDGKVEKTLTLTRKHIQSMRRG